MLVAGAFLYAGLSQFGDFVCGVREIVVSLGEITPEAATAKALKWLRRDVTLPEEAIPETERAFHGIDRYEQLPLLPGLVEPEPEAESEGPLQPQRRPRRQPLADLLQVEVRRRSRDEDIEIKTVR